MVVQNNRFIFLLYSRFISIGFSLVDSSPFLLILRCTIAVFIYFSRYFLMSFYVRSGQVFRKPCLIDLRRIAFVGLKSSACRYYSSSSLVVWPRILFSTTSDCCVSRGTSHIPVFLFLAPFMIYCTFFRLKFLACIV